jgi:hypothetical protein
MKNTLLSKITILTSFVFAFNSSFSQLAMDFNTNDCNGNPVHLFSDLDAGKAVVLFYYMPNCGSCPPHATEIQTMTNHINANYPGMVKGYSYPYQDVTDCVYSASWVVDNNLPFFTPMNNGATSLAYYGEFAMPTIVLLGGSDHSVMHLYDQGFDVSDTVLMRNLILDLIDPAQANTVKLDKNSTSLEVYPNPSSEVLNVKFDLKEVSKVSFELIDLTGRKLFSQNEVEVKNGSKEINVSEIPNGSYILKIKINGNWTNQKVSVKH